MAVATVGIYQELTELAQKYPQAYYCFEGKGSAQELSLKLRATEYALWNELLPGPDDDIELVAATMARVTGKTTITVINSILAHYRLAELPWLKTLQENTFRLDNGRLVAIDRALSDTDDAEIIKIIDERLARYLVPRRINQVFPTGAQIRRKIYDWIRQLDVNHSVKDRKADPPKEPEVEVRHGADGRSFIDVDLDTADALEVEKLITLRRKEKDLNTGQALLDLLRQTSQTKVILNVYRACDVPDAPAFIFGTGWVGPQLADSLAERAEVVRDMDEIKTKVSPSYQTPPDIRAYIVGRDGTCRVPGCTRRADLCQMDHSINHADGGLTTAGNMEALCQPHHNMKTDGRIWPIQLGEGEIIWLFDDGTWLHDSPEGPLAAISRNWVQTVSQKIAKRRENLRKN